MPRKQCENGCTSKRGKPVPHTGVLDGRKLCGKCHKKAKDASDVEVILAWDERRRRYLQLLDTPEPTPEQVAPVRPVSPAESCADSAANSRPPSPDPLIWACGDDAIPNGGDDDIEQQQPQPDVVPAFRQDPDMPEGYFLGTEEEAIEAFGRRLRDIRSITSKIKLKREVKWRMLVTEDDVSGGIDRCQVGDVNVHHWKYDDLMDEIERGKCPGLKMGREIEIDLADGPFIAMSKKEGQELYWPVTVGILVDHIDYQVDTSTVAGKCFEMPLADRTAANTRKYVEMKGDGSGRSVSNLFPRRRTPTSTTVRKGQTNNHGGSFIGAAESCKVVWKKDENDKKLPEDQFYVVRGEYGEVGGMKDERMEQTLHPVAPIAAMLLEAFPLKLKRIPSSVSKLFDGSKYLTYLTTLLTVGNESEDEEIYDLLEEKGMMGYCVTKSGKYVHVDFANAKDTPNVAITQGAYDEYPFAFPTLRLSVKAPSGSAFIGDFANLLHAVGGGTGIRLTSVFCQHECIVSRKKEYKNGKTMRLVGAKRNRGDLELDRNVRAKIRSLSDGTFDKVG